MRWIKWADKIPDNWEAKINRLIGDTFAIDNALFEHINDGLQKIGGTGRAEYHQLEWLDESIPVEELEEVVRLNGLIEEAYNVAMNNVENPNLIGKRHFGVLWNEFKKIHNL